MFHNLDTKREGDHHTTFHDVVLAAKAGGRICKALLRFREDIGSDEVAERFETPFVQFQYFRFWGLGSTIEFTGNATWLADGIMPRREIHLHVSDPESTPEWWASTLRKSQSDLLTEPRRVRSDDSGYVALSHCWGKDPSFLTLTNDNLPEYQHGIQVTSLPKSFVDSVRTSIQLGVHYIWIDSLCIVQSGSEAEEDWQYHTAAMDMIYAHCDLNIAVACAASADEGAFVDRDTEFLQMACVQVDYP